MEKLDVESLFLYQRNKNIFCEGIENSKPARYLKSFFRLRKNHYTKKSKIVFTPRIIEYPIVFQYLKPENRKILDFGCVEDLFPIHLASMGYKVTGLDFRSYPFEHENFNFIQGDILTWEPLTEQFDTVVSISTVEHVGLSAYGDPVNADGDKIALQKLWQALRQGGTMVITVPAGKNCIERGMRIYDEQAIQKVFPKVDTIRFFYKQSRYAMWEETNSETIAALEYENYKTIAPAQGLAVIISQK